MNLETTKLRFSRPSHKKEGESREEGRKKSASRKLIGGREGKRISYQPSVERRPLQLAFSLSKKRKGGKKEEEGGRQNLKMRVKRGRALALGFHQES